MPSTSAGARDSMPSTAMPTESFSSRSARPGKDVSQGRGPLADRVGQQELTTRRGPQPVVRHLEGALVGDLEPPDLLDGVAPELEPEGMLLGGREHVEDASAHRELAASLHEVGARVGGGREVLDRLFEGHLVPGGEGHRAQVTEPGGDRLEHCAHRRHDDGEATVGGVAALGVGEPAEHGEALPHGVAARAQALVRQRLPRGEQPDGVRAENRPQRRVEVFCLTTGGRDRQHRTARGGRRVAGARRRGQRGDDERAGTRSRRGGDLGGGRRQRIAQVRHLRNGTEPGEELGQ